MTGAGNATTSTLDNPSFSIWTGGTTPTDTGGSGFHKYNQVRGPSGAGESNPVNDALTSGGVLTGSNGWVAYEVVREYQRKVKHPEFFFVQFSWHNRKLPHNSLIYSI
jgi:hypothetical protein